jgi:hypothetical protein
MKAEDKAGEIIATCQWMKALEKQWRDDPRIYTKQKRFPLRVISCGFVARPGSFIPSNPQLRGLVSIKLIERLRTFLDSKFERPISP